MDLKDLQDVTDPSDFPADILRKLDSSLRCDICKEFYDGPVLLHCGHTFCSLCIRSVLPNKPECPTCRMEAKESHLVRNSMFGQAVNAWSDARALVLRYVKESLRPPPSTTGKLNKRKRTYGSNPGPNQEAGPSRLSRGGNYTSSSDEEACECKKRRRKARRSLDGEIIPTSDPEEQELPDPAHTNPPIKCPLCLRQVPYNSINPHIDSNCKKFVATDTGNHTPTTSAKPDSKAAWDTLLKGKAKKVIEVPSAEDIEIPTTRIAKVSYGVMKANGVRKLLTETGLPTTGNKEELIARHERWIAIYNANLDRVKPQTVGELKERLKELEEIGNRPGPKKIVDEKAYVKMNKAQFDSLVEAARPKIGSAEDAPTSQTTVRSAGAPPSSLEKDKGTSSDAIVID